jgi:uncharacterized protein (TIGR00369 family)
MRGSEASVQERYAPDSRCFGCGPANQAGLRIASHLSDDELVATWQARPEHQAFEGAVNGGIIGTLLDCHSNWTAAMHLMSTSQAEHPPSCVTADYAVSFHRPTPSDRPIQVRAWVVDATEKRATVDAELIADGQVTATCRGTFVAVGPGHPAYGRW